MQVLPSELIIRHLLILECSSIDKKSVNEVSFVEDAAETLLKRRRTYLG